MSIGDDIVGMVRDVVPGKKSKKGSLVGEALSFIDNLQNKSAPVQMGVGGGAGIFTGYLFTRGSKATASVLGVSLIVFQFYYRGYIKLNRSKFENDVRDLRKGIEKELYGKTSAIDVNEEDIAKFLSKNAWLLSGFAAGWLLGYGLA